MKCCDDFINALFADRRCQMVVILSLIDGNKQRKRNVTIINYPFNNSPLLNSADRLHLGQLISSNTQFRC